MRPIHHSTREGWLECAVAELRDRFARAGHTLPQSIHVTCGWPSARALTARRAVGEAWRPEASATGTCETFISPCLDSAADVLPVLVHELAHHAVGVEHGHRKPFADCASAVGLLGPMTSTRADDELRLWCQRYEERHGAYPHGRLDSTKSGRKKQSTRMLKLTCPECGYLVRTTAQWIAYGFPTCPCGSQLQPPNRPEGPEAGDGEEE